MVLVVFWHCQWIENTLRCDSIVSPYTPAPHVGSWFQMQQVQWPRSLTCLSFGARFNQDLLPAELPTNLESSFGYGDISEVAPNLLILLRRDKTFDANYRSVQLECFFNAFWMNPRIWVGLWQVVFLQNGYAENDAFEKSLLWRTMQLACCKHTYMHNCVVCPLHRSSRCFLFQISPLLERCSPCRPVSSHAAGWRGLILGEDFQQSLEELVLPKLMTLKCHTAFAWG